MRTATSRWSEPAQCRVEQPAANNLIKISQLNYHNMLFHKWEWKSRINQKSFSTVMRKRTPLFYKWEKVAHSSDIQVIYKWYKWYVQVKTRSSEGPFPEAMIFGPWPTMSTMKYFAFQEYRFKLNRRGRLELLAKAKMRLWPVLSNSQSSELGLSCSFSKRRAQCPDIRKTTPSM